jgi:hypothetical protein
MSSESLCCICLDLECNFLTDCCKNKIHKNCIINWIVYKGEFNCPLCRSDTIRVPINDLLTTSILEYGLTSQEISSNLNKLMKYYNTPYHITINIQDNTSNMFNCLSTSCFRYTVRRIGCRVPITIKIILYLILIPLFYIILFTLIQNFYVVKNVQYLDD